MGRLYVELECGCLVSCDGGGGLIPSDFLGECKDCQFDEWYAHHPLCHWCGRCLTCEPTMHDSCRATVSLEAWEADQMEDPEFRAAVEELEPAYQVARLRIMRGLTQEQLAELVGAKQSSIARLESGNTRLSFLRRVAEALGGQLQIRIVSEEEIKTYEDIEARSSIG